MMTFELAKKLKDAGFKQSGGNLTATFGVIEEEFVFDRTTAESAYLPLLSELIEACGEIQMRVWSYYVENDLTWQADNDPFSTDVPNMKFGLGSSPEEAVANLWLKLNATS